MKKLLALLLCLMMIVSVFTLASCKKEDKEEGEKTFETLNGKTAEELYNEALAKLQGLDNFETVTTQVITMKVEGQKIDMNQVVITKKAGQNVYTKSTNDMEATAEMEVWYVDEWLYAKTFGQSFKANISYEQMEEEFMPEGANADGALLQIPESWFKDIAFRQSGNSYYIEFIVSGDEYLEYLSSASGLGNYLDGIDDVSYKVYFTSDGELRDIVTEFKMEVQGVKCDVESVSVVKNVGSTTITAPEGTFADYTEYYK